MTSKEKIRDIKSVINEFYHNEKCEGRLTECARKSWLLFQEYCDDILQALERLEMLEKENKEYFEIITKQAYLLNNKHIDRPFIEILQQENEKFKKVIEIYRKISTIDKESTTSYLVRNGMITQQEYELLKEVLGE